MDVEKIKSALGQLVGTAAITTPAEQAEAPLPPNMQLAWQSADQLNAARLTTDGETVIAYEVATTKAVLGEWQWKRVRLPVSPEALMVMAKRMSMAIEPIAEISARLLLLQATVLKLLDDPATPDPIKQKITHTLREIGVMKDEFTKKS